LASRDTQHGIAMISKIFENVTSFAIWYALWQLADFIFKAH
jgi:hypothetical protein